MKMTEHPQATTLLNEQEVNPALSDQDVNSTLDFKRVTANEIVTATVLSVVILIIVIGNLLVIIAVSTTPRLRTVTNFFVVSLAVTDLLMGLLVTPLAVVREFTSTWVFGRIFCELWISLDVFLCTASILNLCCISLDRYFAITSPLTYAVKRSGRLALFMVALVWILSAAITCPPAFGWHETGRNNSPTCEYNSDRGYIVYSALGSFYIPAFVIVFVYWRIFAVARKRQAILIQGDQEVTISQTLDSESSQSEGVTAKAMTIESDNKKEIFILSKNIPKDNCNNCENSKKSETHNGWNRSTKSKSSLNTYRIHSCHQPRRDGYERAAFQRERRVAKSLSIVVGGFLLCWSPFFAVYLIEPFCSTCTFHPILLRCLVWLGWLNSAINPFIYALNNKDFKRAFLRLTIYRVRRPWKVPRRHNPSHYN
ncbi:octopamine receptor Oamb-like [Centruroides sculpturatus]|uniref:octopamine receptor Oamb-like n=1 Tax=Centruroides sculpturatus TaxID=218467 RepID=UPI000C6DB9D1|nr:octopamine receptor Oamb-like [Centruroides sculpturatus]XP_023213976.1 octopamine receptor Oamb-like [Centruroides sculpturatus]XP_023213977.1 octopamine receptor Oamb-like [Centruroides sculpturatus]